MKGRKQQHCLGINLLPGCQNTQCELIVTKKASDNIVSLSALSHNRGFALKNASTEAELKAHAKLGGWGQRQRVLLPLPPSFKRIEATRIINPMGPEEPAAHKVAWNPNTYRDFHIRHLLKTNISQLLNIQPWDQTLSSQTAGCRWGPHMENCSSVLCVYPPPPAFLATESARVLAHTQILLYLSGQPLITAVWIQNWVANPFTPGYMTVYFRRHYRKYFWAMC